MIVSGIGHCLPQGEHIESVQHPNELQIQGIRQAGYKTYWHSDCSARTLASGALREALDRADVSADDLKFIVAGQSGIPDYVGIDLACQVGAELGGLRLRTVNLVEGCGSGISAWFAAERLMSELEAGQSGALVFVQRASQPHQDRFGLMNAVLSDGAVAAVVSKPHKDKPIVSGYIFRGGQEVSETRFVDMMRIERGGAVKPFVTPDHDSRTDALGRDRIMDLYKFSTGELMEFLQLRMDTTVDVITKSLAQAGWENDNQLVLLHTLEGYQSIDGLLSKLQIQRSNRHLLPRIGHMGCVDPLISVYLMEQEGLIKSNDRIVMSTISTGMKWCCALLEAVSPRCLSAPALV